MKIRKYDFSKAEKYLNEGKISKHIIYNPDRYNILLEEDAIPQDAFWVDKKHKNGPEIHVICKNATILIFNERTKNYVPFSLLDQDKSKDIIMVVASKHHQTFCKKQEKIKKKEEIIFNFLFFFMKN